MENNKRTNLRNTVATAVAAAGMALAGPAVAKDNNNCSALQDAWINGSIETTFALNDHLSALDIDTGVENCNVVLTGAVENDTQRDLAEQLAAGTDRVQMVDNRLDIERPDQDGASEEPSAFGIWVSDATIGATVKSKLLANENVDGTAINVDVEHGVVILDGLVQSGAEADLAVMLANNTDDVREVRNELDIAG